MSSVYSKRFIGGQSTPSVPLTISVPSGVVWVVRSITCVSTAAGATQYAVIVPGVAYVFGGSTLAAFVASTWYGRQVVNAGEPLQGTCVGGPVWFMVSGYELTLP